MQLLLYYFLCLCVIFIIVPSPHSLNLQNCFRHEWICFNFSLTLCCPQHSSYIRRTLLCCLLLLLMVLVTMMSLPFYLDVIFYVQHDVFINRQAHRHILDCNPVVLSTLSFHFPLLKAIILVLLRDRQTSVMARDI